MWSDGVPITCADFQYTWNQIATGKDIYDPTGYLDIDNGRLPRSRRPRSSPTRRARPTPAGSQLFAADAGIFPSHILKGKDRDAALKDGYTWSGGPWIAKWNKGDSIVLTPNPSYWGTKPHLEKVSSSSSRTPPPSSRRSRAGPGSTRSTRSRSSTSIDAIKTGLPGANTSYNAKTGIGRSVVVQQRQAPVRLRGCPPGVRRTRSIATRS